MAKLIDTWIRGTLQLTGVGSTVSGSWPITGGNLLVGSTAASGAAFFVPSAAGQQALAMKGYTGQSTHYWSVYDSSDTLLTALTSAGVLSAGSGQINALSALGSQSVSVTSVTANSTLGNHYVMLCSGAISAVLPDATTVIGRIYQIKNIGASVVTATPSAGQTIDGNSSYVLNTQYSSVTLVSNGTNWFVL